MSCVHKVESFQAERIECFYLVDSCMANLVDHRHNYYQALLLLTNQAKRLQLEDDMEVLASLLLLLVIFVLLATDNLSFGIQILQVVFTIVVGV